METLLSALLLVLIAKTQICSSQDVIRGERDKFRSDIKLSNGNHVTCKNGSAFCECGKDGKHNTFIFNNGTQTGECVEDEDIIKDNQGCYRFSDNKFLALVENRNIYNILAPKNKRRNYCQLNFESKLSIGGYTWSSVYMTAGEFSLYRPTTNGRKEKTLEITNTTSLLTKWPGRLLRLDISCYKSRFQNWWFENHCLLLKISGSAYIKLRRVSTTSITSSTSSSTASSTTISTSSPTSSPTSLPTSSPMSFSATPAIHDTLKLVQTSTTQTTATPGVPSRNTPSSLPTSSLPSNHDEANSNSQQSESDDSSLNVIPIVASVVGLFCLLLIVIGILLYRWRKRSTPKQDDINLYEDADSRSVSTIGSQQTSKNHKFSDVYDLPGTQINMVAEYDYISAEAVKPDTRDIDNEYEYATREEAGDKTSSLTASELHPNDIYQAVEENIPPNGNHNQNNPSYSGDIPIYHTLEDNGGDAWDGDQVYQELDEIQKSEPVYNVLEEPE